MMMEMTLLMMEMMRRRYPANRCASRLLSDFTMNKFPTGSSSSNHPSQSSFDIDKDNDDKHHSMSVQPWFLSSQRSRQLLVTVRQKCVKGHLCVCMLTYSKAPGDIKFWLKPSAISQVRVHARTAHTDGGCYHHSPVWIE